MSETCVRCDGEGFIVTCCDDICNGVGYCIHGDGEEVCPDCHGDGEIWDDDDDDPDGHSLECTCEHCIQVYPERDTEHWDDDNES